VGAGKRGEKMFAEIALKPKQHCLTRRRERRELFSGSKSPF
jgi:hypothetical protein